MTFAVKLTKLLEGQNIYQGDLAQKMHLTQSTLGAFMQGKLTPTIEELIPVARVLNVSLEWLADDNSDWPPPSPKSGELSLLSPEALAIFNTFAEILVSDGAPDTKLVQIALAVGTVLGRFGVQQEAAR